MFLRQDFLGSTLTYLHALPSQAHLTWSCPGFVLLLPHKNLLPQPMSHYTDFKLPCFACIQGALEKCSPQTPVQSYHLLAFPTRGLNSSDISWDLIITYDLFQNAVQSILNTPFLTNPALAPLSLGIHL